MATRSETRAHGLGQRWGSVLVEEARERTGGRAQSVRVERGDRRLEPCRQLGVAGAPRDRAPELEGARALVRIEGVQQPLEQPGLTSERRGQLRDPGPTLHGAIVDG